MRTIAIANQKGGCGKTTTSINLSYSLARRNQRVLLVDCDPQAHATMGLNIDPDDTRCMYQVLTPRQAERLDLSDVVVPINSRLDLAPSSMLLSTLEQELAEVERREDMLLSAIRPYRNEYDYIILDCPPSIGHLCFNALRASGEAIVPIDMSLFSLRGVIKLVDIVLFLKNALDHDIQIRALVTMFDFRTRYARRVLEKVQEEFGENVFETVIRYNVRLRETVDYGLPVGEFDCKAIGHQDYEKLADEVAAMKPLCLQQGAGRLGGAQYLVRQARSYIGSAGRVGEIDMVAGEVEELLSEPPESSYSEMIDVITRGDGDYCLDDEDF